MTLLACGGGGGSSITTNNNAPALPLIVSQPQSATVAAGGSVTFSVTATSSEAMAYQWYRVDAQGTTTKMIPRPDQVPQPTLTLNSVSVANYNANQFYVTVTNSVGTVTSQKATLTVTPSPQAPVITVQPVDQSWGVGNEVTFSVTATSSLPMTYQWYRIWNGTVDPWGLSLPQMSLGQLTLADNGSVFYCVVSNSAGSTTSGKATLTVVPTTQVQLQAPISSYTWQAGDTPLNIWVRVLGTTNTAVTWNLVEPDAGTLVPSTQPLQPGQSEIGYVSPVKDGVYGSGVFHLTATSVADPTKSATLTITVVMPTTLPVITQQPVSTTATMGSVAKFQVLYSGTLADSVTWMKNGTVWLEFPLFGTPALTNGAYLTLQNLTMADNGAKFKCILKAVVNGTMQSEETNEVTLTVVDTRPDLTAGKVILTQGAQRADNSMPLIDNRPMVVLVWMTSNHSPTAEEAAPQVYVYDATGNKIYASQMGADTHNAQVVDSLDNENQPVGQVVIPATYVKRGYRYVVKVNANGAIQESNYDNNFWPTGASDTTATNAFNPSWQVSDPKPLKVVMVPVQASCGTGSPDFDVASNLTLNHLPITTLNMTQGATLVSPVQDYLSSQWLPTLFTALKAKRLAEDPTAYYYGVVKATGAGWQGMSVVGNPADTNNRESVGIGTGEVAHELGHALGWDHANCGNPGGVDPRLYPDGKSHAYFAETTNSRWNQFAGPITGADLMSYCTMTDSDIFWQGVIDTRAASTTPTMTAPGSEAEMRVQEGSQELTKKNRQDVLMLLGSRKGNQYTVYPTIQVKSIPTDTYTLLNLNDKGEWLTVELVNSKNQTIYTTKLNVTRIVTHDPTTDSLECFGGNLPAPKEPLSAIVIKDSKGTIVKKLTAEPTDTADAHLSTISEDTKFLNTTGHKMTLVQDPDTFEVVAVHFGDTQTVIHHKPGSKLQILTSDGLNTKVTE
jgi:hypothetical protein